jgi:preprotein translocase subunit SecA
MLSWIIRQFSGRHYRKFVAKCMPIVRRINEIEVSYQKLTPEELRAKTEEFRSRLKQGIEGGKTKAQMLEELLPEAYAAAKNAARRLVGQTIEVCGHPMGWQMVHFDVQLIGGIALHQNRIAEMATGEGKTLVATLPLYLNALTGGNCQLVTVNDYLARRDSEWMGYLYRQLGLTVGCLQNQMGPQERQDQYGRDITYGTASEFGFDYLRDNGMTFRRTDQVQRDHYFAIIDEVDSILIDEARTPLIISGQTDDDGSAQIPYLRHKPMVERLVRKQESLCNAIAGDAKDLLIKDPTDAEGLSKLLKAKLGTPKNKQLLKLMEEAPIRKAFEKYELEMMADYNKDARFKLKEELYYTIDERQHIADLTELGRRELSPGDDETMFLLPDLPTTYQQIDGSSMSDEEKEAAKRQSQELYEKASTSIHCISQLLRAYSLYEKDVEYIIQDGKVMIVDENTGRVMPGRRWSDGLHSAIEAKEGVAIEKETKTFATITLQNYFRMYEKLAGMTGTAETEATEFSDIYKLNVMVVPTNKPVVRRDDHDLMYKTRREKFNAVIAEIEAANKRGQPVLVGTASVEASELLSRMLRRGNIPHNVLNAKHHEMEADIVSRAGLKGAVTIATNMAGRGTDIKLGEGVAAQGGLFVIGTERHQSRRIDRQLRGRSGRQGDPGLSRFYVSLEDDLMRLFGNAGQIIKMLENSFEENQPIQHPLLTQTLETAQKRFEESNYLVRKRLLQYDDVLNRQRQVIYDIRNNVLNAEDPSRVLFEFIDEEVGERMMGIYDGEKIDAEAYDAFIKNLRNIFPFAFEAAKPELTEEELRKSIVGEIRAVYDRAKKETPPSTAADYERYQLLRAIDSNWQTHLTAMDDLRDSVSLRGYGQRDPLNEYKTEAFRFFEDLLATIRSQLCAAVMRAMVELPMIQQISEAQRQYSARNVKLKGPSDSDPTGPGHAPKPEESSDPVITIRRTTAKVGRNDPCPCGSGKKYKACCGKG